MPRRHALIAVASYLGMTILAFAIGAARGLPNLYFVPTEMRWLHLPFPASSIFAYLVGTTLAVIVIVGTRALVSRTRWARFLHDEFTGLLGDLSLNQIALLSLGSGIAEELLFRGALLPWWGLLPSSLAFGLLHIGPTRKFATWTLWALVMGLALGSLFQLTGELLAPVVAHVLINYENMRAMRKNRANALLPPGPVPRFALQKAPRVGTRSDM